MNLRKDENFVQDEHWYEMSQIYDEFLNKIQNKNVVLLEIGVGFNTPGIIRFPFEQMTANNLRTTLIRINKDYPSPMLEIENKTINYVLKLQKGSNMVRITAVDQAGNIEKVEKKIIVSGSTTIEPKIQNGQIIIDIKDPDGIKDIVINLNGVVYQAKDVNQKSVRIPLKPVTGVNTLKVTVTNVNSLVSEGTTEINYAQ